jgi:type IV pilus assembly protein PilC
MPTTTYEYRVRDREGKLIKSQIEADSVSLVANRLREMGYTPIHIKATGSVSLKQDINIPGLTDRVNLKQIAIMSRQLATMVASGLTLVRALSVLSDQVDSKPLRNILQQVRQDVEQGSALSAALERHPKVFGPLYISMVRAGEAGGQLDTVLMRLSTTIEKSVELRSKVKSAMTYPTVVFCAVILIVTLMMIFVVPTFKKLFASLNGKLPLPTRIVIAVSNVLASWRLAIVIAVIVAVVVLFRRWIGTEQGRDVWDRFKLRPPIFGPLIHKICLSRFATTLSSLVSAGVPIIESLEIVGANVGNTQLAKAVRGSINGVREGRALSSCLADYPIMPTMVTQMIETGEESGALDTMLEKIGAFYDNEVSATVASLTSLLEPLIILFMGGCIGVIVVSLYLPMFDYVKLLTPGGGSAG